MRWLYEILAFVSTLLTPLLHKFGIPNLHYPDAILVSVVIPFVNLMNDEVTKGIISEENWYQGLRYMLGIYVEPTEQGKESQPTVPSRKRFGRLTSEQLESIPVNSNSTCHKNSVLRRCDSTPIFNYSPEFRAMEKPSSLRRNKSHSHINSIVPYNACKDQQQALIFPDIHISDNQSTAS